MNEPISFGDASARAQTIANALALGRSLDLWSLILAALALAGLLGVSLPVSSTICLLVSVVAGSAQKIYALRVAFDEALFRQWAETWRNAANQGPAPAQLTADLAAFDQALAACSLRAPYGGAPRNLNSRLHGAGKLLRRQVLALAMQIAAMIGAMVALHLPVAG